MTGGARQALEHDAIAREVVVPCHFSAMAFTALVLLQLQLLGCSSLRDDYAVKKVLAQNLLATIFATKMNN